MKIGGQHSCKLQSYFGRSGHKHRRRFVWINSMRTNCASYQGFLKSLFSVTISALHRPYLGSSDLASDWDLATPKAESFSTVRCCKILARAYARSCRPTSSRSEAVAVELDRAALPLKKRLNLDQLPHLPHFSPSMLPYRFQH